MQQREQHQVDRRQHRPAVAVDEQVKDRGVAGRSIDHHARAHIHHHHGWDDDLVCGDGDDVCQKNHAVQTEEQAKGLSQSAIARAKFESPNGMFAKIQMIAPAGAAVCMARHKTKMVRSMMDVYKMRLTLGLR